MTEPDGETGGLRARAGGAMTAPSVPLRRGWRAVFEYARSPVMASVAQISAGNLAVLAIQVATGFLMARWVAPYDMGVWNTVSIVLVYAPFLTLGVFSGLNRELPYLVGRGLGEEARGMAEAAYGWAVALAAVTCPAVLVVTAWFFARGQAKLAWAALALGVTAFFWWFSAYLGTTYRTHHEFGRLARNNTIVALVGVVLMLLVRQYGFHGMLVRAALLGFLAVAALHFRRPIPVRPRWGTARLVSLVKVGVPIYILGQLSALQGSLDRVFLMQSTHALGLYTLALQAGTAASLVPNSFSTVVYPRMAQRYGETQRAGGLWVLAAKASLAASALGAAVGIAGWVATRYVVEWFLPNYVSGIRAAQWASFLGLAMGLYVFNNIFNIIKRQDLYLIGWSVGIAGYWAAWKLLTRAPGADLTVAAAQAMLVSTFLFSLVSVGTSWWACAAHDRRAARVG